MSTASCLAQVLLIIGANGNLGKLGEGYAGVRTYYKSLEKKNGGIRQHTDHSSFVQKKKVRAALKCLLYFKKNDSCVPCVAERPLCFNGFPKGQFIYTAHTHTHLCMYACMYGYRTETTLK